MKSLIFITILFVTVLTGCGGPSPDALSPEISTEEAFQFYENGTFFLDVRTREEWDAFHAPNSTLIPLDQLSGRIGELPKDELIVVVCRSGNRSASGRDILLQAGFAQVTSMAGGLTEWISRGYPITSTP